MSDYYGEQEGGGNVFGWLIYASAALFLVSCIIKYMQISLYK